MSTTIETAARRLAGERLAWPVAVLAIGGLSAAAWVVLLLLGVALLG